MMRDRLLKYNPIMEQVGIFSKAYEANITPSSESEIVIPHNLGIIPHLCIIEINNNKQTNGYLENFIGDFIAYGTTDKTGFYQYQYYYNDTYTTNGSFTPISVITITEQTITLGLLYSMVRSKWNTNASYHIRIWG